MQINQTKIWFAAASAAALFSLAGLPANAAGLSDQLPKAGASYVLSDRAVSLKDVANTVSKSGRHRAARITQTAAAKNPLTTTDCAAASGAADNILDTVLTENQTLAKLEYQQTVIANQVAAVSEREQLETAQAAVTAATVATAAQSAEITVAAATNGTPAASETASASVTIAEEPIPAAAVPAAEETPAVTTLLASVKQTAGTQVAGGAGTTAANDSSQAAEDAPAVNTDNTENADTAASAETGAAENASQPESNRDETVGADNENAETGPAANTDAAVSAATETADDAGSTAATGSNAYSDPLRAGAGLVIAVNKTSLTNQEEKDQEQAAAEAAKAEEDAADAGAAAEDTAAADAADGRAETADTTEDEAVENFAVSNTTSYLNIRAEASTDADIVGRLPKDSVATILEDEGNGWVKIESGNVTGYVSKEFLVTGVEAKQAADEKASKLAKVTTETLRVRAAADPESDVIGLVGEGEELNILSEENGWLHVSTDDGEGYISADFADTEVIYDEAKSQEEIEAEEAKKAEEAAKASGKSGTKSSSGTSEVYAPASSGSATGAAVVAYAEQFLGNPYVWGGTSLTNGADCSGFTMSVFAHFGVSLPHYDASQRSCGTAVASLADAVPGDLICYYGHVGIYIGNGQIIHASNPRTGITIGNASYRKIAAIRRLVN